ncbi:MAG TPA: dihydropteroate synthase [Thermodesulfobacteriota bacterium]|nr:dihydropteroate synthase [Thermodesulfobacteriota bacterium]
MGILNVTPDSFSDGGKFYDTERAVEQALIMQEEGADIIDIGGESSRPGAKPVPFDVELSRVMPVLKAIVKKIKVIVSIDTIKAAVAEAALSEGAEMVNDVSALRGDPKMAPLLAMQKVPVVLMHMRGTTPQSMQANIHYRNLISEIIEFLTERISFAQASGIGHSRIIIDPGIGFGKSIEKDNFTILKHLEKFKALGKPILVGPSRKAFLGHLLDLPVNDLEEATAAAVAVAVMNGANIVRVHDIKKIKRVVRVADAIKAAE